MIILNIFRYISTQQVDLTQFFVKYLKIRINIAQCENCRNSFTLFSQKFREGNGFTKEITK